MFEKIKRSKKRRELRSKIKETLHVGELEALSKLPRSIHHFTQDGARSLKPFS